MPRHTLKAYTSVIARLPQALADEVKRYASQHRCSVSDLIRAGLELRLAADSAPTTPGLSRDAEVLQEVVHTIDAMAHLLRTQIEDTVRETLPEVLQEVVHRESRVYAAQGEVLQEVGHGNTEVVPHAEVLQGHTEEGYT